MTPSFGVQSNRNFFTLMAICLLLTLAIPAQAVTSVEVAKLLQSDGVAGDLFAISYSIDGDTVILGANLDDDIPNSSGSAYVYVRNTAGIPCPETSLVDPWCQEAKLAPEDPEAFEWFGYAVAVSGDTAVVTARRDDNDTDDGATFWREGSAYVFTRSGSVWTQQAKLRADDLSRDPWFGTHADIQGDTLVVGARKDDQKGEDAGAAYVFTRTGNTWSQQAKLMASDGDAFDLFGTYVALDGNLLAVGAHGNDDDGNGSGSAYVFVRDGTNWTEEGKLTADDAAAGDLFGIRLSLSGNTVVVGSPQHGIGPGAAYVFGRGGFSWSQQAKLTASDGVVGDGYGFTVGISGNVVIVGADTEDGDVVDSDAGAVYVYQRSPIGWVELQKVTASDGGFWFGSGLDFSGDSAVIAALPFGITFLGSAYVLEFDIDDDGSRDLLDNCPITPNPSQSDSNGNGIGDECDIGATQTFGDGGLPYDGDGLSCSSCLANGWTFNAGGLIPDAGEEETGDVALLYDNGTVSGYHLQAWDGFPRVDTRVIGDLANAYAAVLRFNARHSGVGDGVTLRAFIFNFHDDRLDGALSNTAASIASTDTTWQTFTIPIDPASLEAFPFDELNPRTITETLSDVSLFGLRHDPGFTGPGTPAPIAAAVYFDDIELIVDPDIDGDGIDNDVDTAPWVASFDFGDGTTFGTITDLGNQILSITDAPSPDGVRITAAPGGGPAATVNVCGAADLSIDAVDDVVVTCGSVQVFVFEGELEMVVEVNGEPAILSIPADNKVTFEPETPTAPATFTTPPENTAPVIVEVGGAEIPIAPGESFTLVPFDDFFAGIEIRNDKLEIKGGFAPGSAGDDIGPLSEDVTVSVGSLILTVPAGSMSSRTSNKFKFEGPIDGVELELKIDRHENGSYTFKVEAETDLSGAGNPIGLTLTIGNDAGTISVDT